MEIKINSRVGNSLSEDERKYLYLLEFHSEFIKRVRKIRVELGLPFSSGKVNQKILQQSCALLLLELRIPLRFYASIESFVKYGEVYNAMSPIQILGIRNQEDRKYLYNHKIIPPLPILDTNTTLHWHMTNKLEILQSNSIESAIPLILINKSLTKLQLFKAIEEKWIEIAEAMNDFNLSNPYPDKLEHIPLKRLKEDMQIFRLRKDKLSYFDIKIKFEKEYGLRFEEESLRKKYSELNKLLIELGFVNK